MQASVTVMVCNEEDHVFILQDIAKTGESVIRTLVPSEYTLRSSVMISSQMHKQFNVVLRILDWKVRL